MEYQIRRSVRQLSIGTIPSHLVYPPVPCLGRSADRNQSRSAGDERLESESYTLNEGARRTAKHTCQKKRTAKFLPDRRLNLGVGSKVYAAGRLVQNDDGAMSQERSSHRDELSLTL